jgi:ribosomal protein S8
MSHKKVKQKNTLNNFSNLEDSNFLKRTNVIDMSSAPLFIHNNSLEDKNSCSVNKQTSQKNPVHMNMSETILIILRFLMEEGFQHTFETFKEESEQFLSQHQLRHLKQVKSLSDILQEYAQLKEKDQYRQRFLQQFDNDDNLLLVLNGMYDLLEASQHRLQMQHHKSISQFIFEKRHSSISHDPSFHEVSTVPKLGNKHHVPDMVTNGISAENIFISRPVPSKFGSSFKPGLSFLCIQI